MTDLICLDPRIFYNTQDLSCDRAEPIPPIHRQNLEKLPSQDPRSRVPTPLRKNQRSLEEFRRLILQNAAQGTFQHQKVVSSFSPQALSLLAALPWGCSSGKGDAIPKEDNGSGWDNSGRTGNDSTGGATATAGAESPSGSTSGSWGTKAVMDGGHADSGESSMIPTLDQALLHATAPCGSEGTLPDLDDQVGVCANYTENRHELFSWNPEESGQVETLFSLGFAPDQVLSTADKQFYITHHGNPLSSPPTPGGLAVIDQGQGLQSHLSFPNIVMENPAAASDGSTVNQFTPTFPKGIVRVGSRLFVAASNLVTQALPVNNYFNPGMVLIYSIATKNWEHYLISSDFNPTSIEAVGGKVYVVNSGDINPARGAEQMVKTPSSIDVIDPANLEIIKNIPLNLVNGNEDGMVNSTGHQENFAAGITGEIAASADGKYLALPTGDNSGQILLVNLQTDKVKAIQVSPPGEKVLLTSIIFHPTEAVIYVANFNDGKLYTMDLESDRVIDEKVLDNNPSDFAGISDGLWVGSSVFLGVGREIYRLPVTQ